MTALTADTNALRVENFAETTAFVVKSASVIYKNALCALDATGYLVPWVDRADYEFVGRHQGDQITGDGSALTEVSIEPEIHRNCVVDGVTSIAQVGNYVYCADDNYATYSLTPGHVMSQPVGRVHKYIKAGYANVEVLAFRNKREEYTQAGFIERYIEGHRRMAATRFFHDERFLQLPTLNASLAPASADDTNDGATAAQLALMIRSNLNFEVIDDATNLADTDVDFHAGGGVDMGTHGASGDQAVIGPQEDTDQTFLSQSFSPNRAPSMLWQMTTGASIAAVVITGGLKLTNDPAVATDNDQAIITYSAATDTYWEYTYSIGGTDTETATTITPALSTNYLMAIIVDSGALANFYIGAGTGNPVRVGQSTALTAAAALSPFVGIESAAIATKDLIVRRILLGLDYTA